MGEGLPTLSVPASDDMTLPVNAAVSSGAPQRGIVTRFIDANKRYCRTRLQPRLYPVTQMAALDHWFRRRMLTRPAGGALLEFGCGRTFRLSQLLRDRFSSLSATDIEDVDLPDVPNGIEFRRCTTDRIPFADAQFDVVVIRSVIEHLEDPETTFSELARVTKPGGAILMNLPNKWDYVSVLAMLTGPLKSRLLKSVVRIEWDDYPVHYRANTKRAVTRVAAAARLRVEQFQPLPSQPGYLSFFVPLYILGACYQFAISLFGLDVLQPSYVVLMRKEI